MSDNIPLELQVEIIKWLPVKSLLQFRSVSKTWKSLIDGSQFIKHYSGQQHHLLVSYDCPLNLDHKYVSIVDDDSFPQERVSPTLPLLVKRLTHSRVIGTSHGLLCLYSSRHKCIDVIGPRTDIVVLWNVSIRKLVVVVLPNIPEGSMMRKYETVLGFGVCIETHDPKIVKIRLYSSWSDVESASSIPWQVEVFALSTSVWRSPMNNLPRKSIRFGDSQVVVNGVLYWLATDSITMDDRFGVYNLIVSFDLTTEEFREITLPDSLANQLWYNLSIFKLREYLVVLERNVEADTPVFIVWMMDDGVPKAFTKQFVVNVNTPDGTVNGFNKNGEPIIEIEDLGTNGMQPLFSVYPYIESMLLLDQPEVTIYKNGERYILK